MQASAQTLLETSDDTRTFAMRLAPSLPPNTVIALYGELGAGKTTFVQGLLQGLSGVEGDLAQSPTFTYMHLYPAKIPLAHFDLYRLVRPEDFFAMGFDETFEMGAIVAIEWPERLGSCLPAKRLEIRLAHAPKDTRTLEMRWIH